MATKAHFQFLRLSDSDFAIFVHLSLDPYYYLDSSSYLNYASAILATFRVAKFSFRDFKFVEAVAYGHIDYRQDAMDGLVAILGSGLSSY